MSDAAVHGPDRELLDLLYLAFNAPVVMALPPEEAVAFRDRVVSVRTYDELEEADRELVDEAVAQVRAGASPTLQGVESWDSDWAAEDAALDADDDDEPEEKALPDDDGDWVGIA